MTTLPISILISHTDAAGNITVERFFEGSPRSGGRKLAAAMKKAQEDPTARIVSYFGEGDPVHIVVTQTTLNSTARSEDPVEFSII